MFFSGQSRASGPSHNYCFCCCCFFTKQQYFEYMKRKFISFKYWGEVYIHIHRIKLNEVKWPFSTKTKAGAVGIKNFLEKAR